MSFKGGDPGRNKCITDNKILEQQIPLSAYEM
jgi:hypothetical protein